MVPPKLAVTVSEPNLAAAFSLHPLVEVVQGEPETGAASWSQGDWRRSLAIGAPAEVRGLIETMDNNPMVCCDRFSVPGPMATLALLALAPAARAGIVASPPRLSLSHPPEPSMTEFLSEAGVPSWHAQAGAGGALCRASARFALPPGCSKDEVGAAFGECYDRAFFVRIEEGDPTGLALAFVRLEFEAGDLIVSAAADPLGKAGPAQCVHAFNVMCGFVESLGVTDPVRLAPPPPGPPGPPRSI